MSDRLEVEVVEVALVTGQEPDNSEDFVTDVYVTFELAGNSVARLLGVQYRTLDKHAAKITEKRWIAAVRDSRFADEILVALKPYVRKEVYEYCLDEFGERPRRLDVDWAETFDSAVHAVTYDPKKELLHVEFEVSVVSM